MSNWLGQHQLLMIGQLDLSNFDARQSDASWIMISFFSACVVPTTFWYFWAIPIRPYQFINKLGPFFGEFRLLDDFLATKLFLQADLLGKIDHMLNFVFGLNNDLKGNDQIVYRGDHAPTIFSKCTIQFCFCSPVFKNHAIWTNMGSPQWIQ